MAEETIFGKRGEEVITTDKSKMRFNSDNASIGNAVAEDSLKLHPQPTEDPLDPLNWSTTMKHVILAIVMFKYVQTLSHLYAFQRLL